MRGLADRLRNLLLALDRQDRLESASAFVGWLADESEAERLGGHAREMLLRALKTVADPVNYDLVTRLDPLDGVELSALLAATGLGRVALSERLNDLVQTGLASRELVGDQVRSTALAAGLLEWIEATAADTGKALAEQLAGSETTTGERAP